MFCHKKSSLADLVWNPVWFLMAIVGVMTVAGTLLSRAGKLKGNCRRLADRCGQAVEDAAGAVATAMEGGPARGGKRSGKGARRAPSEDEEA